MKRLARIVALAALNPILVAGVAQAALRLQRFAVKLVRCPTRTYHLGRFSKRSCGGGSRCVHLIAKRCRGSFWNHQEFIGVCFQQRIS